MLCLLAVGEEVAFPAKPRMQRGLLLGEVSLCVALAMRKQARGSQREGSDRLLPGASDRAARWLCCAARSARIACACECGVACGHTAGYRDASSVVPRLSACCVCHGLIDTTNEIWICAWTCRRLLILKPGPAHQNPASAASTSVAVTGSGSQPRLLESSQHSTQVIDICVLVHLDVVVGLRLGRWRSVGELDARRQHCAARCCCRCHARPAPHGRQFRRSRTVTVAKTASGLVAVHRGGGGEGAKPYKCACRHAERRAVLGRPRTEASANLLTCVGLRSEGMEQV